MNTQLFSEGSLHQTYFYYCLSSPPPEIFRPSAVSDTTTRCDFILFRRQKTPNMYRKIALISNFIKQIATFKAETICFFSDFQAHRYTMVRLKFHPSANLSTNHNAGRQSILVSLAVIGWSIFRRRIILVYLRTTALCNRKPEGNQMVST